MGSGEGRKVNSGIKHSKKIKENGKRQTVVYTAEHAWRLLSRLSSG